MSAPTYEEFVAAKVDFTYTYGSEVDAGDIHPLLLPHQSAIVRWCVQGGRRAIFAAFGLGKSLMQIEVVRLTMASTGGRGLIVCPLGVRHEFRIDAAKVGVDTRFIRRSEEVTDDFDGIWLTNYESIRDGRLDVSLFEVVSLDEASVLRSYGTLTTTTFVDVCRDVPHKFVATATPSPNRYLELVNYADFLGIMDKGQCLTRFFQRDSTSAGNLTLYPHKEAEFWLWLQSWAVFLQKPSDLGYADDGYTMPELEIVTHEVPVDHLAVIRHELDGQAVMFRDTSLGVVGASREKRDTMPARIAKMAEIVESSPDDHFILWHDLEDERKAIKRVLPEAVEVYGSLDLEVREQRVIDFADGRSRLLATKPELSGSGCNFQRHCHRAVFVGIGFQFNDFIQAVHRIQRFGQTEQCRIDIIYAESEREVLKNLMTKWQQHRELVATMSNLIREHGLNNIGVNASLVRSMGVDRVEVAGDRWLAANNDCVVETAAMADNSIDMVLTSIPFSNHYEYTPNYNDFGHTDDLAHFMAQMDYLTPQLLRILRPGRIYACHVKDRIEFGNMTGTGYPTVSPFHAEILMHSRRHGFEYCGMITVLTDVVRENNQSYRLSWSEQCKDGTKMGVGSPEYVLIFRKPQTDRSKGYADTPVAKSKADYTRARWQIDAHAFWRSSGDCLISSQDLNAMSVAERMKAFEAFTRTHVYDYAGHVQIGEELDAVKGLSSEFMMLAPASHHEDVWSDVNRLRTLNSDQVRRAVEKHVCPFPLDIVERLIRRYTNEDDLVFDPFGGLGSTALTALRMGRRGRMAELNSGYFADAVRYLRAEEAKAAVPTLFDLLETA